MLQLTIDIGHEVKYQNKMLSEMVSLAFSVTGKFVLHCRYSVVLYSLSSCSQPDSLELKWFSNFKKAMYSFSAVMWNLNP